MLMRPDCTGSGVLQELHALPYRAFTGHEACQKQFGREWSSICGIVGRRNGHEDVMIEEDVVSMHVSEG